jgi:hypothetical protein
MTLIDDTLNATLSNTPLHTLLRTLRRVLDALPRNYVQHIFRTIFHRHY